MQRLWEMFQPGVKSEKATEKAYFSHRGETSGKCSSTAANLKQHQQRNLKGPTPVADAQV